MVGLDLETELLLKPEGLNDQRSKNGSKKLTEESSRNSSSLNVNIIGHCPESSIKNLIIFVVV
jgi:hypothetical protein